MMAMFPRGARTTAAAWALRHDVGQLMIAGLEGPELSPLERAWWRLVQPGGVILFRRNIEEGEQTFALLRAVAEVSSTPLLRCVDVEGGLVDRFRDVLAPVPSAAAVAATGDARLVRRHAKVIGGEVRALGMNVAFAPVLDLALPVSSLVMRTRVVSADPAAVTRYAAAFLSGLAGEGVMGCGKHFPGLGGGTLDSHAAMPSIERDWQTMWREDLAPYRALAKRLPMVMVSHAAYPRITKTAEPASISKFWMRDVLEKKLKYRGLVVSDDMEMGGILTQRSMEEAAVEAVAAGMDVVEICKDPALVLRAFEALLREAERSAVFRKRVQTASRKIRTAKRRWKVDDWPAAPTTAKLEKLRAATRRFTDEVLARSGGMV